MECCRRGERSRRSAHGTGRGANCTRVRRSPTRESDRADSRARYRGVSCRRPAVGCRWGRDLIFAEGIFAQKADLPVEYPYMSVEYVIESANKRGGKAGPSELNTR